MNNKRDVTSLQNILVLFVEFFNEHFLLPIFLFISSYQHLVSCIYHSFRRLLALLYIYELTS